MTDTPPLRIAIADDHRLVLAGISRAVERAPDMRVVALARSGEELLALLVRSRPDVVLLDVSMPSGDGLWTLSELRRRHPNIVVVMLSASDSLLDIDQALEMGAASYVTKTINPLDLPSAIRQAIDGTVYHPRGAAREQPGSGSGAPPGGLSQRELEILRLVAEGLSNQEVGERLYITTQTVKFHLSNLYRKIGVANRTEATRFAFRNRIVVSPEGEAQSANAHTQRRPATDGLAPGQAARQGSLTLRAAAASACPGGAARPQPGRGTAPSARRGAVGEAGFCEPTAVGSDGTPPVTRGGLAASSAPDQPAEGAGEPLGRAPMGEGKAGDVVIGREPLQAPRR